MPDQKSDYYTNRKRKIVDFLIGFAIFPLLYQFCMWVLVFIAEKNFGTITPQLLFFAVVAGILLLLAHRFSDRRFIGKGITAFFAVLMIAAFGSCFFPR